MANDIDSNPLIEQYSIAKRQAAIEKERTSLGQEDFLKLMLTELQHQNPMEPKENGELLSQMAQFSSVQGMNDMQNSLTELKDSLISNQALEASSLVGRFVMVPGGRGYLPEGEGPRFFGGVELEESTPNLTVTITAKSGEIIRTIAVGSAPTGLNRFEWDGMNDQGEQMPAGEYNFSAQARFNGDEAAVETMFVAPVESVTLGRNGEKMKLNVLGFGAMDMSAVREII